MVGTEENIAELARGNLDANMDKLPNGDYVLVGVDIDTTGRRLIDEIVHLAAFTPEEHFEQYIMPYMNLNPAARQRHQMRVISIGFYRMLKSMQTYKIIKSKSEIAALRDFLSWLEALKAKQTNALGIILVYYEERKFIPFMILEALNKYDLLDRFSNTVKSFANGFNLAKNSANESFKHYSLRKLYKNLSKSFEENELDKDKENNNTNKNNIAANTTDKAATSLQKGRNSTYSYDRDQFDGNASVRAKLAYTVALQLSNINNKESLESPMALKNALNSLKPYVSLIKHDLQELDTQNANLERQNSFRPVFLNYFKTTLYHRVRAVKFRIILAENGFDLQTLNDIWKEKRSAGLLEALQVIQSLKTDDKMELSELLDSYFDPNKTTIKPVVKMSNRRRNRRLRNNKNNDGGNGGSSRSVNAEFGAGGDKPQSTSLAPDSTTKTPPPGKQNNVNATTATGAGNGRTQRKRNSRNFSSNLKAQPAPNSVATEVAAAAVVSDANQVTSVDAPVPIATVATSISVVASN